LISALEHQKKIEVQDWIFHFCNGAKEDNKTKVRKAEVDDFSKIREYDEGFFQNLERNITNGELFISENEGSIQAFGIIEKSKIWSNVASLGMFVPNDKRGNGYGSEMIKSLALICEGMSIISIAGCFSKNAKSISALKRAGMISTNRLLKVEI
jgi:RimJ/RimL family protein N-acetyltransferase